MMDFHKLFALFVFFICFLSVNCIGRGCGSKYKECDIGEWQPWERCNASCGGGFRQRRKPICCDVNQVKSLDECLTRCNLAHDKFTKDTTEIEECGTRCYYNGVFNASTYSCDCINGTWGSCCQHQENECRSNPCHHGFCQDKLFGFSCNCYAGYSGKLCETGVCNNYTCGTNSHCVPKRKFYRGQYTYHPFCVCLPPGSNGNNCSNHYCDTFDCQNNGTCYDMRTFDYDLRLYLNVPGCRCESGFYGSQCEFINRCTSNPCLNGGYCQVQKSNFMCRCRTCYSGELCQTYTQDNTTRCPPLTTDLSTRSSFIVTETTTKITPKIVTHIALSKVNTWGSNVKLISMSKALPTVTNTSPRPLTSIQTSTATSLKLPKSTKAVLSTQISPKSTKAVLSTQISTTVWFVPKSTVLNTTPSYLTFVGSTTSYRRSSKSSVVIQPVPYTYNIQGIDMGQCLKMPCVRGRCIPINSGYYCNCYPGYEGTNCEQEINECEKDPCMHGTCIDHLNSFECQCNSLYKGPTCNKMETWFILTLAIGSVFVLLMACCCILCIPSCTRRKEEENETNELRRTAWT